VARELVERDKVVSITYVVRDARDEIAEVRDLPVAYLHGAGSDLFPRIEQALDGHAVGDQVTVELPPQDGFGEHDPALTFTDDLDNTPPEIRFVGAEFELENQDGERRQFRVTRIADGKLTVDCNHPFAGQTVKFVVTVAAVRDATPEELRAGVPQAGLPPLVQ